MVFLNAQWPIIQKCFNGCRMIWKRNIFHPWERILWIHSLVKRAQHEKSIQNLRQAIWPLCILEILSKFEITDFLYVFRSLLPTEWPFVRYPMVQRRVKKSWCYQFGCFPPFLALFRAFRTNLVPKIDLWHIVSVPQSSHFWITMTMVKTKCQNCGKVRSNGISLSKNAVQQS